MTDIFVLVHHDSHFGTAVDTYDTETEALAAAEVRLAEFSRHGPEDEERYPPREDTRFNVTYGPEGAYVEVMRTHLNEAL